MWNLKTFFPCEIVLEALTPGVHGRKNAGVFCGSFCDEHSLLSGLLFFGYSDIL